MHVLHTVSGKCESDFTKAEKKFMARFDARLDGKAAICIARTMFRTLRNEWSRDVRPSQAGVYMWDVLRVLGYAQNNESLARCLAETIAETLNTKAKNTQWFVSCLTESLTRPVEASATDAAGIRRLHTMHFEELGRMAATLPSGTIASRVAGKFCSEYSAKLALV